MEKDKNHIVESRAEQSDEMSEAEIDKNLMGSFPASDPPSWTLGTDHHEETESAKDKSASDNLED
jgi:hypothetical protein